LWLWREGERRKDRETSMRNEKEEEVLNTCIGGLEREMAESEEKNGGRRG
jgi:hypothetical protein